MHTRHLVEFGGWRDPHTADVHTHTRFFRFARGIRAFLILPTTPDLTTGRGSHLHLSMLEGGALPPRYNNFLLAVMAVAMILTVILRWLPVELLFVFGGFILLIGARDASEWRRQHTPKETTDAVAATFKSTHLLKEEEERKREEKRIRYEAEVEAEMRLIEKEEKASQKREQALREKAMAVYFNEGSKLHKASPKVLARTKSMPGQLHALRSLTHLAGSSAVEALAPALPAPQTLPPPQGLDAGADVRSSAASDSTTKSSDQVLTLGSAPSTPERHCQTAGRADSLGTSPQAPHTRIVTPPPAHGSDDAQALAGAIGSSSSNTRDCKSPPPPGQRGRGGRRSPSSAASPAIGMNSSSPAAKRTLMKATTAPPGAIRRELDGNLGYSSTLAPSLLQTRKLYSAVSSEDDSRSAAERIAAERSARRRG